MTSQIQMPRRHFMAGLAMTASGLAACANTAAIPSTRQSNDLAKPLSREALEDALTGSSYLGCGGGGSLAEARALIAADLAAGHAFKLRSVATLRDDERVACPYGLGSIAPGNTELQSKIDAFENPITEPVQAAFELLERHLDIKFSAVILGELGPHSMAEGLSIAARLGVAALDADTVGRATPEINQHSVRVSGNKLTPTAVMTQFGDEIIIRDLQEPARGEEVIRTLSVSSGIVGVVDAPITGAIAKQPGTLITGSFSLAQSIGQAVRLAKANGDDPIEAARVAGNGYTLFTGIVGRSNWRDADGFLVGDVMLSGRGPDAGRTMKLDYKNEHLVARLDGQVIATCPDLITLVDEATADGIGNPDFTEGQLVRVLGFRADPLWRTEAGLDVFSPRYFGYDVDYIPIETRLKSL